jgi:tetratricopeptide (TPR) repeat protein
MVASELDLEVVDARTDKARRMRVALVLTLAVLPALFVIFRARDDLGFLLLALVVMSAAVVFAWRSGMVGRAQAMFRIATIRREGLAATALLHRGDVEGAELAYAKLLRTAKPLGAFHAGHVLMYGVTRFFQGDAEHALLLANRALASGWFDLVAMRPLRDAAETWRVLMLLASGRTAEAREHLDRLGDAKLATADVSVALFEEEWESALERAKRALEDSSFPSVGRPTIASLGRHAADKLGRVEDVRMFDAVLAAEPLGPLARKNPAFRGFVH